MFFFPCGRWHKTRAQSEKMFPQRDKVEWLHTLKRAIRKAEHFRFGSVENVQPKCILRINGFLLLKTISIWRCANYLAANYSWQIDISNVNSGSILVKRFVRRRTKNHPLFGSFFRECMSLLLLSTLFSTHSTHMAHQQIGICFIRSILFGK